ncbi:MAG: hypothetical protein C0502_00950 [Opitutus sp.]|nr:hypothetical protein [Opitutus sp.]
MKRLLLFAVAAALTSSAPLHGSAADSVWTGSGSTPYLDNAANWEADLLPPLTDGTASLLFGNATGNFVTVNSSSGIYGLKIYDSYRFEGWVTTLTLGAGGLLFSPSSSSAWLKFHESLAIQLSTDQTWAINGGTVDFEGYLAGSSDATLTKTGAGRLVLRDGNTGLASNIALNDGSIEIVGTGGHMANTALGTGTLTIGPATGAGLPALVARDQVDEDATVLLGNNLILNGVLNTRNDVEFELSGAITLNSDTTFNSSGDSLTISGAIGEASAGRKVTVNAAGAIILTGSNGWTGGTQVDKGVLVFAGENNTPGTTGGITVGPLGYVGITTGQNVGGFLGQLNTTSSGAIGFDSPLDQPQSTFGSSAETAIAIDLSGFNANLRLGSASHAILGPYATITPQGGDYRFGGGGGVLSVATQLTGSRGLVVDSPAQLPLTLRLMNTTNNFTGAVSVTDSALVFGDNQTAETAYLPAGTMTMDSGSYIGSEDPDLTAQAMFSRFSTTTPGIIGFDIAPNALSTRVIDLTGVQVGNSPSTDFTQAYIGTSSFLWSSATQEIAGPGVRLTGTIEPDGDGVHRFAAYKGGALEVAGTLTGNALVIGQPDALGAFGDRIRELYSTVLLTGNNGTGLAGGTTFYGGRLMIGQSNGVIGTDPTNALGAGPLTIAPVAFTLEGEDEPPYPLLSATTADIIVPNNISLQTEIDVGGDSSFTLAGNISGGGELYVGEETNGAFTLTLSGNNTFTGGVHVSGDSTVNVASNTGLGAGPLQFESSAYSSAVVNFVGATTNAPVIGGLSSPDYSEIYLTVDNTVLTVNQPSLLEQGSSFRGYISANGQNARLVKDGPGVLSLEGGEEDADYGFYATGFGGTGLAGDPNVLLEVRNGTLVLGNGFYLDDSSSSLWVNGGALILADTSLSNPIIVSAGALGGRGTIDSSVTIGNGAKLMAGYDDTHGRIGELSISELTLASGGVFEWDIIDADNSAQAGHDKILVSLPTTLTVSSTPESPFLIRPVSLNSAGVDGILGGLTPGVTYSWTLISYQSIAGVTQSINPANIALDPTLSSYWQTSISGTLSLEFTNLSGSGELLLNFTAVPEPSTYALFGLGLGLAGLAAWRRRRV